MLLRATTADEINGIAANQPPPMASLPLPTTTTSQNGSPHLRHHSRRHGEEGAGSRRVHVYQGQQAQEGAGYAYPANQSVPRKEMSSGVGLQQQPGGGGQQPGPLVQPGQVQQYQTHVFAPVVTGAPMKKPKYSVSGSSIGGGGSVGALAGAGGGGPAGAGGKSPFLPSLGFRFVSPFRFACSHKFYVEDRILSVRPCIWRFSDFSSQYPLRSFPFFILCSTGTDIRSFPFRILSFSPFSWELLFEFLILFSFVYHTPLFSSLFAFGGSSPAQLGFSLSFSYVFSRIFSQFMSPTFLFSFLLHTFTLSPLLNEHAN
jgi:hypothetical protein